MVSERKRIANRLNAKKSTGPRTQAGKQKSRLNSTRHGLRSRLAQTIVPQSEQRSFHAFQQEMLQDLQPQGATEHLLAQRLCLLAYKLQRLSTTESLLFDRLNEDHAESIEEENAEETEHHEKYLEKLPTGFQGPARPLVLTDPPPPQSSSELLADAFFDAHDGKLPQEWSDLLPTRAEMFTRLQRYTTSAERSFHRTLREFLQLQKLRRQIESESPTADDDHSKFPIEPTEPRIYRAEIDPIEAMHPSNPQSALLSPQGSIRNPQSNPPAPPLHPIHTAAPAPSTPVTLSYSAVESDGRKAMKQTQPQPQSLVVGIFDDRYAAEQAVDDLEQAGLRHDQVGYAIRGSDAVAGGMITDAQGTKDAQGVVTGLIGGGAIGAILGAAAALVVPGVGPVISAGILTTALGGAAAGAATGGILGALSGLGVSEEEAMFFEKELRSGKALVTADAGANREQVIEILRRHGARQIASRTTHTEVEPGSHTSTTGMR